MNKHLSAPLVHCLAVDYLDVGARPYLRRVCVAWRDAVPPGVPHQDTAHRTADAYNAGWGDPPRSWVHLARWLTPEAYERGQFDCILSLQAPLAVGNVALAEHLNNTRFIGHGNCSYHHTECVAWECSTFGADHLHMHCPLNGRRSNPEAVKLAVCLGVRFSVPTGLSHLPLALWDEDYTQYPLKYMTDHIMVNPGCTDGAMFKDADISCDDVADTLCPEKGTHSSWLEAWHTHRADYLASRGRAIWFEDGMGARRSWDAVRLARVGWHAYFYTRT